MLNANARRHLARRALRAHRAGMHWSRAPALVGIQAPSRNASVLSEWPASDPGMQTNVQRMTNLKGKETMKQNEPRIMDQRPVGPGRASSGAGGYMRTLPSSKYPTHRRNVRYLFPLPVSMGGVSPFLYKDVGTRGVHTDKFTYGPRRAPASVWIGGKYVKHMPAAENCGSGITKSKASTKNVSPAKGRRYSAAIGAPGYPGISGSNYPLVPAKQYALEARKQTRIGRADSRSLPAIVHSTEARPVDAQEAMYRQFTHEIPYLNLASYAEMGATTVHPESAQTVSSHPSSRATASDIHPSATAQVPLGPSSRLHAYKPTSQHPPSRGFSSSTGSVGSGSGSTARQYSPEETEALRRMEDAVRNRDVHDTKAGHAKESDAEKAHEHWTGQMPREEEVRHAGGFKEGEIEGAKIGHGGEGPVKKAAEAVGEGLEKLGGAIAPGMTEKVKHAVSETQHKAEEWMSEGGQKLKDYFDDSTKPTDPAIERAAKQAGHDVQEKAKEWQDSAKGAYSEAKDKSEAMWNEGVLKARDTAEKVKDSAEEGMQSAKKTAEDWKESAKDTAEDWKASAEETAENWAESAKETAQEWKETAEDVYEAGKSKASEWKEDAKEVMDDYSHDAEKTMRHAKHSVKDAYVDAKDKIEDVVEDVKHSKPMKKVYEMAEDAKKKGQEYMQEAEHSVKDFMKDHPHPIHEAKEGAEKYSEPIKQKFSNIAHGIREGARESISENDPNLASTKESLKDVGSNVVNIVKDLGHVANVGADVTWRAVEGAAGKLLFDKEPESSVSKGKDASTKPAGSVGDMADFTDELGDKARAASEKIKGSARDMAGDRLKDTLKEKAAERVTSAAKDSINPFKKGGFFRNLFFRSYSTHAQPFTTLSGTTSSTPATSLLPTSMDYVSLRRAYSSRPSGSQSLDQGGDDRDLATEIPFEVPQQYSPWNTNQPHGVLHGEFGDHDKKKTRADTVAKDTFKTPFSALANYHGMLKRKDDSSPFDFVLRMMSPEPVKGAESAESDLRPLSTMNVAPGESNAKGKRELDSYFQQSWAESVVSDANTSSPFVPKSRAGK